MKNIKYTIGMSNQEQILNHLKLCDKDFIPKLSERVSLDKFSKKIHDLTVKFEAWDGKKLIGLVSVYLWNEKDKCYNPYINNVSVLSQYRKTGIAEKLLNASFDKMIKDGCYQVRLEVYKENKKAIELYNKLKFKEVEKKNKFIILEKKLNGSYFDKAIKDVGEHKYHYNFDFDVMHPFMIKSFEPFFVKGNILELGSFDGSFTKRLLKFSNDITCVEASKEAIDKSYKTLGNKVAYFNNTLEAASLPSKYDNIILTHVLEHLDNPVLILKRIKEEWLSDNGNLFIACPNANAASRQIAVKMGIISHNSEVTISEKEHGHKITYSLDTLERDVKKSGLNIIHRSGIFFKVLANFQWDKILNTDIISKEYLDGCYRLGQHYPDLCSSIFFVCCK